MRYLRNHWFDIGGVLGLITLLLISGFHSKLSDYQLLMWLSLTSLFFHQFEEYRLPGTFPGMINRVMFHSDLPDRYPLNSNTSLIINLSIGWLLYLSAALVGDRIIWLGIATILVSLGNILAHTFLFNIKGKTIYNAGMATSLLFFIPCVYFFFKIIEEEHLVSITDYLIGIPLGIIINIFGVFKLIIYLSNSKTKYIFKKRQLLAKDRK
ncbi:MAG TPA: HXXEE domain-containing protein [Edaphocola sp.]|nr:HXXEE domain-containing protein [Edaphocola sp.]